jgi:large subunit ribosomal protein L27Ae
LLQGFFKVCGKGELPKTPCIVRAKMFSKIAEKRIREAGGVTQLIA